MARETLFETQEVTGFVYMEGVGYVVQISPAPFTLTVGETYVIVLDGKEYTRTAFAFDAFASGVVAVGNDYPVTGVEDPDNLPVIVGYDPNENYVGFVALAAADELEIGVYKEVAEDAVYYSVSSLSLKALGNAIRAKSGTGEALAFPDGMVEAVGNITGGSGGGSSDYPDAIHTVTFMNGGEELRVRAVVDGDNCADVADRGLIEQPARESTATAVYTYSGWSLTDGGSANSAALSNVTEDRTVYAAYTSAVRYYTVTYYDEDGVTVLNTELLEYGAMPRYVPIKSGYYLDGWTPEVASVTGDIAYTAKWKAGLSFASSDWSEIVAAVESGEASTSIMVGDTREETFGTDIGTVTLMVMGFNHDDLADGSGKAGMTIGMSSSSSGKSSDIGLSSNDITRKLGSYLKTVKKPQISKAGGSEETITSYDRKTFEFSLNELGLTLSSPTYFTNAHEDGSQTYEAVTQGKYTLNGYSYGYGLRGSGINNYYFGVRFSAAAALSYGSTNYNNLKVRYGFCI